MRPPASLDHSAPRSGMGRPGRRLRHLVPLGALLLSGCAVVHWSSPQGCETRLVIGLAALQLGPSGDTPAVVHVRVTQLGLYATQGAGTRLGLGYFQQTLVAVDPTLAEVLIDSSSDALGRHRVVIQAPTRKDANHETSHAVVCFHGGLGARGLRE